MLRAATVMVVAVLVFGACGGGGQKAAETTTEAPTEAPTTGVTTTTVPQVNAPVLGGTWEAFVAKFGQPVSPDMSTENAYSSGDFASCPPGSITTSQYGLMAYGGPKAESSVRTSYDAVKSITRRICSGRMTEQLAQTEYKTFLPSDTTAVTTPNGPAYRSAALAASLPASEFSCSGSSDFDYTGVFHVAVFAFGSSGDEGWTLETGACGESNAPNEYTPTTPPPAPPPPAPKKTLVQLNGSGAQSSDKFTTSGDDWDLSWTYDCSASGGTGNFIVHVRHPNGDESVENSAVNQLGPGGSGVNHYHTGGTYYLDVNSECRWTVQVSG